MAKKSKHNLFRIIVSIIYIVLGGVGAVMAVRSFIGALGGSTVIVKELISTIAYVAAGVVMFVAGILGFLNIKPKLCRILGLVIFVIAAVSLVLAILSSGLGAFGLLATWISLAQAVVAWLFVFWMKNKK